MKTAGRPLIKKTAPLASEPLTWLNYGLVFALLWLLLSQGDTSSWVIGIVVVPLATWCAMRLFQPESEGADANRQSVSITAVLRFIPFFLEQSLRGGWESALFAIHPKKRLYSGFVHYRTRLPLGRARLFFINTVSLLPGTVSATWQHDTLTIHALDKRMDHYQALRHCETRVATLFNIRLDNDDIEHARALTREQPLAGRKSLTREKSLTGEKSGEKP